MNVYVFVKPAYLPGGVTVVVVIGVVAVVEVVSHNVFIPKGCLPHTSLVTWPPTTRRPPHPCQVKECVGLGTCAAAPVPRPCEWQ